MSAESTDPALEALRKQIDGIDAQIVELLNQRAGVVVEVGKHKQQSRSPIYAPDREKLVLEKVRKLNKGPPARSRARSNLPRADERIVCT